MSNGDLSNKNASVGNNTNIENHKNENQHDGIYFDEETIVYYGEEKTTEILLQTSSRAKLAWNVYAGSKGPSISMGVNSLRKGYFSLHKRGVKIKYITEIRKDNLNYCKELQKIASLRHIDSAKGGMAISESSYVATAILKESSPVSHLIYSNVKEIVEHQQSIFDSLWKMSLPSEMKIKEIEEGMEPIETKILDSKDDIYEKIELLCNNSDEILIASEIGILRLIHNNLFECYQRILHKYEKGYHRGIRLITTISKDYSELIKLFMNLGIQIRHIQNPLPINFVVTNRSYYTSIEKLDDDGKLVENMIASNDPIYIKHFKTVFEDLWDNGIDAKDIIHDIDRGYDPETIKVISRSSSVKDLYIKIIESAEREIMIIFPSATAFKRQEKIGLIKKIENTIIRHGIRVRILLSKDTYVDKTMNALQLRCKNQSDLIQYRYIEQMQGTKSTIVIVDRNVSLLMEVKDDKKQNFLEAIGLSTYSNSKAGILSYISIFENLWRITELLEELSLANLKLQKQDILQKEFVHIAAHELRNPIQPIIALSQFLKGYVDKYYKEQNDVLDVIYRNSKRLERLSEDILDITRIESNTIHIKKEEFNLDIFLENVVSDYQYTLRKFPTSLDNEDIISIKFLPLTTDLKIVEWDKEKLNQVVFNLLDNACRFSMENNAKTGEVNVTCETFKDYALVKIIDNGPGIDPEVLPKIFTKFASKSKNGTGLGLFICKNLIESFGGKIWVQSSYTMQKQDNISKDIYPFNHLNEDKGTTIVFSIPLNLKINNNHKTNIIDNNQKSKNHNNKPRKILILDDESDLTITYRIGLESIGFKVDAYNDPIEALSKFIPNYYDLLLLDIRMPKMNGLEFYTCIKK